MRKRTVIVILLALALCGCGWERSEQPDGEVPDPGQPAQISSEPAFVFCLFDISGSTSSPQVRERYMTEFQKLLEHLQAGDALMGDIITENSLATATYPINIELPVLSRFGNPMSHRHETAKSRDSVLAQAQHLILEREAAEASDLLNAVFLAEKTFGGEDQATRTKRALVIFSDMILQHDAYDFTGIDLNEDRITQIIAAEKAAQGGLPELPNVQVWVVGAGAAEEDALQPGRLRQIESFWRVYFEACGADLQSSHYGPTLLSFRLHSDTESAATD